MLYSNLFPKTLKTTSSEESKNAELLVKAGFVDKVMAGVYTWLPLGLRVLRKVENIIRDEMNNLGAQEVLLPSMHPKENWQKTHRWKTLDVLYKIKSQTGKEIALGPTHEEIITPLVGKFTNSYKDLPVALYQIQTKFRDELRAKSGVLRGREFGMKDLYSFHKSEKGLEGYYPDVIKAYHQIFSRCGLDAVMTTAPGGGFTSGGYSDEFQVVSPTGEDKIYVCKKCKRAYNEEVKITKCECGAFLDKKAKNAIEVGNSFKLGAKFSDAFKLDYVDVKGKKKRAVMGCYGIGTTRLVGAIVERFNDKNGIIWPKNVAPFYAHLLKLGDNKKVSKVAEGLYAKLRRAGVDVLYDDRIDAQAGEKFADADLIGIPLRLVVSERTLKKDSVEWKERSKKDSKNVKLEKTTKEVEKWISK
ncbi:MAG: aminoacyl--tRNA ligase-related protein [Patescibacteria group bacterium]|nr:aminoacyl--tRNA ligase-related protein [Patescibacteria group bacterium]